MTRFAVTLALGLLCLQVSATWPRDNDATAPQESLVGEWLNVIKEPRVIKRLIISQKRDEWFIEVWSLANGQEVSWKKVKLSLLGDDVEATSLPYGFASWDLGFSDTHRTLRQEENELIVESFSIFKDRSRRSNDRTLQKFRKK